MSEERFNRIEGLISALRSYSQYRFDQLEVRVKTIELDVEPEGRISEAFEYLSDDIDSFKEEANKRLDRIEQRLDRLEHGQNRIHASLDVILRHITGVGQEPSQD